jgi:hypothetical protein
MPAYPENVRSPGVDRKSPWSGQTDANDPSPTFPSSTPYARGAYKEAFALQPTETKAFDKDAVGPTSG